MQMSVEHCWNDTDKEKPKYSEKNMSPASDTSSATVVPWKTKINPNYIKDLVRTAL